MYKKRQPACRSIRFWLRQVPLIWHQFPNVAENKTATTRYVVDFIAELRGLTTEEVAQATYDNARKVFGLDWEKEKYQKWLS